MEDFFSKDTDNDDFFVPDIISILPLRNTVIFPHQVQPLAVGRPKSLDLLEQLDKKNKPICKYCNKNFSRNDNLKRHQKICKDKK